VGLEWCTANSQEELARVRSCARCTLLFVDRSPPGTRRWCSMERCGNRSKTAHYRQTRRAAGA
jgi:predicted RNA-binding Zn ribbon-like protein